MTEGGIEDYELPKTVINRIVKQALPEGCLVQKDAKTALYKAATIFVSYITAISLDVTNSCGKKTIGPNEVLKALEAAEFENFLPKLNALLASYREANEQKKSSKKTKIEEAGNDESIQK